MKETLEEVNEPVAVYRVTKCWFSSIQIAGNVI